MRKPGPPDVLEISDYPDPEISEAHQVIVKLESSGINPVDEKQRTRGTVYPALPPHILGIDGAGTVIEKGKKVMRLQEGSRVFFIIFVDNLRKLGIMNSTVHGKKQKKYSMVVQRTSTPGFFRHSLGRERAKSERVLL